jgi:hypothetical protein
MIMRDFDTLADDQKFISALILAGSLGRTDEDFAAYVICLLLRRYNTDQGLISRLDFLKDDISVDILTYTQFTYLLNLLDTLFFFLQEDKALDDLIDEDSVLQKILKPYLVTRKKQLTMEALDAAVKKMTGYAALQTERAKWQGILDKFEEKTFEYFHTMEIYTSKTFIDSYYGDMGGICLAGHPEQILQPGFFIQRLADHTDGEIVGMSVLYFSNQGHFLQAFAFNPLYSVLSHYNLGQQLYLYLQFRFNMENLAWALKIPVVISGIESHGLISNNGAFNNLIRKYELSKPTGRRIYANGIAVFYDESTFAKALLIIDPRGYEQVQDISTIPSFYAHRELQKHGSKSVAVVPKPQDSLTVPLAVTVDGVI